MYKEADITINGEGLTVGEAMTLRVALSVFEALLKDGLGEDDTGRGLTTAYRTAINRIHRAMDHGNSVTDSRG